MPLLVTLGRGEVLDLVTSFIPHFCLVVTSLFKSDIRRLPLEVMSSLARLVDRLSAIFLFALAFGQAPSPLCVSF